MPNSNASSAAIDFVTALARVLRDGALRDAFALEPERVARALQVRDPDREIFSRLAPDELEFQARVLLRKRYDLVHRRLPETCRRLASEAWPEFQRYGRTVVEGRDTGADADAVGFCEYLRNAKSAAVEAAEFNRVRFAEHGGRFSCHGVKLAQPSGRSLPSLQILLRSGSGGVHEWWLCFG